MVCADGDEKIRKSWRSPSIKFVYWKNCYVSVLAKNLGYCLIFVAARQNGFSSKKVGTEKRPATFRVSSRSFLWFAPHTPVSLNDLFGKCHLFFKFCVEVVCFEAIPSTMKCPYSLEFSDRRDLINFF